MEEFVFGTLATDELKLIHHRAARRGLQHAHRLIPRDPQPGQPVTVSVTVGPDLDVDHMACYYTSDGSEPRGARGIADNGQFLSLQRGEVFWDTLVWGYLAEWQAELPPQSEGAIVRYRIGAWSGDGSEIFADWPEARLTVERSADAYFRGEPIPEAAPGDRGRQHTFSYSVDHYGPPAWAREAVIYQVFVDRFYPGGGRDWSQTGDLLGICGGTLEGLAEKMDYIADLGATCLWLSPIFVSPSHHGYDATDFFHVEPRLGGDDTLHSVVAEAHGRGMRVLLDYACNHISHKHAIFQDALSDPASRYQDWFTFDDSEVGYRAFFGVSTMPQVNVANQEARNWLIDIGRFWLREYDVDGFRLDYANGPGPDFWTDFWTACKAEKPDSYCFGEVIDSPSAVSTYVGRLDGCLDFFTAEAMRRTFALGRWTEERLESFLARQHAFFPASFLMPTFIDNHDMDRFLFIANGDKQALRRAVAFQMRLPGPPIIYYGSEVGLSQPDGPAQKVGLHVSRVPMLWGEEQDRGLLEYYTAIIQKRHEALSAV